MIQENASLKWLGWDHSFEYLNGEEITEVGSELQSTKLESSKSSPQVFESLLDFVRLR